MPVGDGDILVACFFTLLCPSDWALRGTVLRCPDTTPSPSPWSPQKSDLSGDLEVISAQKEAETGKQPRGDEARGRRDRWSSEWAGPSLGLGECLPP